MKNHNSWSKILQDYELIILLAFLDIKIKVVNTKRKQGEVGLGKFLTP